MRKKLLAIFLCVISVFCFAGCGSVQFMLQVDSSGVVTQQVYVEFSKSDIEAAGKTFAEVRSAIEDVGNQVVQNSISDFESSHQDDEELKLFSGETAKFAEIKSYVYQNTDPKIDIFGRPKYEWKQSTDGKKYTGTITLRFLTVYAYYYFYDIYPDTEDTSNKVTEDHVFFDRTITTSKSPYYDLKNSSIASAFLTYFGDEFSLADMDYYFVYSTNNSKLYSNADQVTVDTNGNTVHIWKYTSADLDSENGGYFETYTIKIKAYMWYMAGIVISLIVALVLTIVVKVKGKNKPQKVKYNGTIKEDDDKSEE